MGINKILHQQKLSILFLHVQNQVKLQGYCYNFSRVHDILCQSYDLHSLLHDLLVFEAGSIDYHFDTVLMWTGLAASALLKWLAEF